MSDADISIVKHFDCSLNISNGIFIMLVVYLNLFRIGVVTA